jgi:hypothetical protein
MFEILGIMFNRSFWREFIVADMIQEGQMKHDYE